MTDLSISALCIGPFARSIAAHLKSFWPQIETSSPSQVSQVTRTSLEGQEVVLLLSDAIAPHLADICDAWCHASDGRFLPVWVQDATLYLGPLCRRGKECCWRCANQSALATSPIQTLEGRRQEYYSRGLHDGPFGFLPSHTLLAAALIKNLITTDAENTASWTIQVDLLHHATRAVPRLGHDGCERCGIVACDATRSFSKLRRSMYNLWDGNA